MTGVALVLGILFLVIAVYLIPIIMIASSDKTKGSEKIGWICAVIFISWFAWVFYLIFAPINKD